MVPRGGRRSIIRGGGLMFIYSCSQTVKTIPKEINDAEHEYMNISPPIIDLPLPLVVPVS